MATLKRWSSKLLDTISRRLQSQIELDDMIQGCLASHTPLLFIKNRKKKNRVEGIASSIYVSYLGNRYIITAGHTFLKHDYKDIYLHATDVLLKSDCSGIIFLPKEETIKTDCDYHEMDYGIFKLSAEGIDKMEKFYRPFPISTDVKEHKIFSFEYFVFGYPSSQNTQSSTRKSFVATYLTLRLPTHFQGVSSNNFNVNSNIALRFTIDNCIRTKNFNRRSFGRAPRPNGLSGCGIWSIPSYPYSPGDYSLQGMLTHYDDKRGLLIGFVIQDMVSMIEIVETKLTSMGNAGKSNILISVLN